MSDGTSSGNISTEQRRLVAIMFTDMVGYTALSQRNEALALELLEEHRRILRSIFSRFNGTEIKTIGDAFLVEFQSALEAAQCALEIQRTLAKRNHDVSSDHRIELRIGIHVGDVVHREGDVYGDGVNIASRIQPVAGIGGICISVDVERQIHHALEARFEKLAPIELKNVEVPMDLFRIVLPWERDTRLTRERREARKPRSIPVGWLVAAALLLIMIAAWFLFGRYHLPGKRSVAAELPAKSIAVLPFENLSRDPDNAFFTDGVQDEILTRLSKIADLKVISRTSTEHYKSAPENLPEIAKQLGVANILEGRVQRSGGVVRVNVQLIKAANDSHLWADTFDRKLTDIFSVESEVAKAIADQLQAKLSPSEKAAIERPPTSDLVAFDLYTQAKPIPHSHAFGAGTKDRLLQAADLLDQAVARDPNFLSAYCVLGYVHDQLYFLNFDHTPARLALANTTVQAALRLQPDAGEAHLARADYLYRCFLDYEGARAEIAIAHRTLPNDPVVFELLAYIDRRQGRWEESAQNFERSIALDPRNYFTLQQAALSYQSLRQYGNMAATLDRALAIVPKDVDTRIGRASIDLDWRADTKPMHSTIEDIVTNNPAELAEIADQWVFLALCERDSSATKRALAALADHTFGDDAVGFTQNFGDGLLARVQGDNAAAQVAFTAARAEQEAKVRAQPDYGPNLCALALIDAGLGRKEDALREGRRAMELLPIEKDSINGPHMIEFFAIICVWTGERDLALQYLATATQMPGSLSYGRLRLHPFWDPLRGDPRFEKIVASLAAKAAASK